MEAQFSPGVKEVIQFSREEAIRLGHSYIGTEHLLLGLIRQGDGKAIRHLKTMGIDMLRLKKAVEDSIRDTTSKSTNIGNIPLTKQAEKALKITYLEAKIFKDDVIRTEHLLLSILRDEDNVASQILNQFGVDYDLFKNAMEEESSARIFPSKTLITTPITEPSGFRIPNPRIASPPTLHTAFPFMVVMKSVSNLSLPPIK